MYDLVRQNRELVLYALWDPQPVKADECISNVVTGLDKTSCCVEYRLELADQVCRQAGQYTITVVQYRV